MTVNSRILNGPVRAGARQNLIMTMPKIFGVGLSKTGTSSLGMALGKLGFKNCDMCAKLWPCLTTGTYWTGSGPDSGSIAGSIKEALLNTQSTTDLPGALFFDELLSVYPDARFIMTTRHLMPWITSARRQFRTRTQSEDLLLNRNGAYSAAYWHDHLYPKSFVDHYKDVLRTVPCCQLLVMNIVEKNEAWDKLCPFLGMPIPKDHLFPFVNPRDANTRYRTVGTDASGHADKPPSETPKPVKQRRRPGQGQGAGLATRGVGAGAGVNAGARTGKAAGAAA